MLVRPLSRGDHVYVIRELLFSQSIEKWSRASQNTPCYLDVPTSSTGKSPLPSCLWLPANSVSSKTSGLCWLDAMAVSLISRYVSEVRAVRVVMPTVGSGVYALNVLPGSAPEGSMQWCKDVMVLPAERPNEEHCFKAAIATVTELGRESGHKTCDAIVTDIRSFTLARINDTGAVQHTELIDLVDYTTLSMPGGKFPDEPDSGDRATCCTGNAHRLGILMSFLRGSGLVHLGPIQTYKDPSERAIRQDPRDG